MSTPTNTPAYRIVDKDGNAASMADALATIGNTDGVLGAEPERFYIIPRDSYDNEPVAVLSGPTERDAFISVQLTETSPDPRTRFEQSILPRLAVHDQPGGASDAAAADTDISFGEFDPTLSPEGPSRQHLSDADAALDRIRRRAR